MHEDMFFMSTRVKKRNNDATRYTRVPNAPLGRVSRVGRLTARHAANDSANI